MIYTKDHKTQYIFDPWGFLGAKRRKLMDSSWAALFREHLLCELPVDKVAPFFNDGFGRPTKELYTALGVLVLQQVQDLTDEETISQLAFNEQWHYALDIVGDSDEAKYICPKTLWNMRELVIEHRLDELLFGRTTEVLAKVFKVDPSKQRIDSVHVKSNMRRLGRVGIFAKSIHTFLVNLKRQHEEIFSALDQDLVGRYLPQNALSCFSMVKPSEAQKTLESVSSDLFALVERFKGNAEVSGMHSFKTLLRVLEESRPCRDEIKQEEGAMAEVKVKPSREVSSDSLQNPSDPDATYSGHKGQGYSVQVMETYSEQKEGEDKETTLHLITHVEVHPACESDSHALIPALNAAIERDLAPEQVLADSLYGSDENREEAKEMGVELTSPTMGSVKEGSLTLSDFTLSEKGKVTACPQGHRPVKVKHKGHRHTVSFDSSHCFSCPLKEQCSVKAGKRAHYLRYDDKTLRIATRRAEEHSAEFKDRYRWRSGIEATMSQYDRTTGVKRLRVRGLAAVRFCVILKAIGINLLRATSVRRALKIREETPAGGNSALHRLILVVKEHMGTLWGRLRRLTSRLTPQSYPHRLAIAA